MFGFKKNKDPVGVVDVSNVGSDETALAEVEGLGRRAIGPGELSMDASNQYRSLIDGILASSGDRDEILRLVSMSDLNPTLMVRMTSLLTVNDYLRSRYGRASDVLESFLINICATSIAKNRMGRREIVAVLGGAETAITPEPPKQKKSWWRRLFA